MARRRRPLTVFSLSFLDAMTCGFGAVVLLYMVINAAVGVRAGDATVDLSAEVDLLERQVLEGQSDLVEARNSLREVEERRVLAQGLSRRLIETLAEIQAELATYEAETLARRESLEDLQSDLKSLEEESKRLSASLPSEEIPGKNVRAFLGEGDRQYLTGLKLGGERIFILLDGSASMLGETMVNILLRRNLPETERRRAAKWQRAVASVDWLSAQLPRDSQYQIYLFDEEARSAIPETEGRWLVSSDRETLDAAISLLRTTAPRGGTNLYRAFRAVAAMEPRPDNLILLTDGLPTQGSQKPKKGKISARQRLQLFGQAINALPASMPVNVVLFPMEGDPMAASSFWKLALRTRGSFISPAKDWP